MEKDKKDKITGLKHPGRILGVIYPYLLAVGVAIGLYYISNLQFIARQEVTPVVPDTTKQEELKVVEPKTIPPVDVMEISQPTDELINKGKEIYTTTCASCHGENGTGTGPASVGLNPAPRNFTKKDNWINGTTIPGIYTTLEEGIQGIAMIAYDFFTPTEKFSLAHYIRQTFVPDPPKASEDDLIALDQTYNLSQGQAISAQIPVNAAMNIIINENADKVEKVNQVVNKIKDDNSRGANIFKRVTNDKTIALSLLITQNDWKQNSNRFVDIIVNNAGRNGYNGNVFKLNASEWNVLYSYLNGYF